MSSSNSIDDNSSVSSRENKPKEISISKNNQRHNKELYVVKLEPNASLSPNSFIEFAINNTFLKKMITYKNKMKSKKKVM